MRANSQGSATGGARDRQPRGWGVQREALPKTRRTPHFTHSRGVKSLRGVGGEGD